jgi:PDZ domain
MPPASPRSRVSRETRLLLLTVLLSVGALLVLARIRFPERPATPALLPPLLTQLAPPSPFEDLSSAVFLLEAEVTPLLELVALEQPASAVPRVIPALRFRPEAAAALLDPTRATRVAGMMARDRATGLAVVRASTGSTPVQRIWTPQQGGYPRHLVVTEASAAGAGLRPVFVGPLQSSTSFAWETSVWVLPRHLGVRSGSFVFTTTGAFAGLIVDHADVQAIVPPVAVLALAERVLTAQPAPAGWIGVDVQDITSEIASATDVTSGVIVAHVDADGPAARQLVPTDIIEQINDQTLVNRNDWDARLARVAAGESLSMRVRRGTSIVQVRLTAIPPPSRGSQSTLGLSMRSRPRVGAEVSLVEAGSIAERAGIIPGDVLVRAGGVTAPTPAQVVRAFNVLPAGGTLLVAAARGTHHFVVALTKP